MSQTRNHYITATATASQTNHTNTPAFISHSTSQIPALSLDKTTVTPSLPTGFPLQQRSWSLQPSWSPRLVHLHPRPTNNHVGWMARNTAPIQFNKCLTPHQGQQLKTGVHHRFYSDKGKPLHCRLPPLLHLYCHINPSLRTAQKLPQVQPRRKNLHAKTTISEKSNMNKKTNTNEVWLATWNINGLRAKWQEASEFVTDHDVITFTETKLDGKASSETLSINGYRLFRQDRNCHGGGVATYITKKLLSTSLFDLQHKYAQSGLEITL